jgi:hypothetical protein
MIVTHHGTRVMLRQSPSRSRPGSDASPTSRRWASWNAPGEALKRVIRAREPCSVLVMPTVASNEGVSHSHRAAAAAISVGEEQQKLCALSHALLVRVATLAFGYFHSTTQY